MKGEKADMLWAFTDVENAQRDDHLPARPRLIKAKGYDRPINLKWEAPHETRGSRMPT
jgi:hypothetical protein